MTMTRPTSEQVTHRGRLLSQCLSDAINVREFGAKGDGVTDDTAAIAAALAAMPNGGALYFPSGTYRTYRAFAGDNIVSSNIAIFGDGASTIIDGNPFTPIANSPYNQFYNVFQATGRNNITLRDMSFVGVCAALVLYSCKNVTVSNIIDDAQLVQNVTGGGFTITNVTVGNPGVMTYAGADPGTTSTDLYVVSGVVGMTELNGQTISVRNLNTVAKTFDIGGTGNTINLPTSSYSPYVSGGTTVRATNWLRTYTIYLDKCADVKVSCCKFLNCHYAVYAFGDFVTQTSRCIVSNCHFEHTTAAGSFTSAFPAAVYWYYAAECIVEGCTFVDIYSSQVRGSAGIGMGYAVYEGDGKSTSCVMSNNTFLYRAKGSLSGVAFYSSEADSLTITGNSFETFSSDCIRIDAKNQDTVATVSSNSMRRLPGSTTNRGGIIVLGTGTRAPKVTMSSNTMDGYGISVFGLANGKYIISGNTIANAPQHGIEIWAFSPLAHRSVCIIGNRIDSCQENAIKTVRCVQSFIASNVMLDGNLANASGDSGSAVLLTDNSYGSHIVGNTIGNTPYGGGLFTYGITNVQGENDRIFKDIVSANTFVGLSDGTQFRQIRFWESSPTNGIYDIVQGDFIANADIDAGESPGWFCVFTRNPSLSSNASSASTTVTVSSTTGFLAGDIVLLTKKKNMYDTSYHTTTEWHADTIASVTNSTQFVLTTGIPAGHGTYVAGTAGVYVARFKAAAAIAS